LVADCTSKPVPEVDFPGDIIAPYFSRFETQANIRKLDNQSHFTSVAVKSQSILVPLAHHLSFNVRYKRGDEELDFTKNEVGTNLIRRYNRRVALLRLRQSGVARREGERA
jgi:hypothetical protein